jgi:kumamolisin
VTRPGHVPLYGSEREPEAGARLVGPAPEDERVEVTVVVRPRLALEPRAETGQERLTRAEYERTFGAEPSDLERVESFAREHGLDLLGTSAARRSVELGGSVAQMNEAFGTELAQYESPAGPFRGRTGPLYVPEGIADVVEAVLGLDDRPQATPHFVPYAVAPELLQPRAEAVAFTPDEIARLYDFPAGLDGGGETIAIVELGGGFRESDLATYFDGLGIPLPQLVAVGVDGARNSPTGDPGGPDGEVMLDIEVAGAVAPGARILVYFAPNTDRGFLDAVTTAIHDEREPSVISISWGAPETRWTRQAMAQMDQAFQSAAMLGVTVCCASGDAGSGDGVPDGRAHVDFPASSPFVLACGGTRLEASDGIAREVVWNAAGAATGGGISDVFDLPRWQDAAGVPASANPGARRGRGVPDVAGDADPATGYRVRVDGRDLVFGGTSAVAPLWAGLVARMNQRLEGELGFLNPRLYTLPAGAFNDITSGTNGAYAAATGWDPCTGLGSPDGAGLLDALGG